MRSILDTTMLVAMLAALPLAAEAGILEAVAIGAAAGVVIAAAGSTPAATVAAVRAERSLHVPA